MDGRSSDPPVLSKNCGAVGVTGGRNARTSPSSAMGRREDDGTSFVRNADGREAAASLTEDRLLTGVRIRAFA